MTKPLRPVKKSVAVKGPSARRPGSPRRAPAAPINAQNLQFIDDLRRSQTELEAQNQALRFSQAAAEGASERFVTLFSNVPLALMVVDERGQILENNGRALDLLRPREDDPPLIYLLPLIAPHDQARVRQALVTAAEENTCELSELQFSGGANGLINGDLHIARLDNNPGEPPSFVCAVIDQGPLLAQRQALQAGAQTLQERNRALLESQGRLAAIIDSSLDAIVCVDGQQQISVFNPAAAKLFDCPTHAAMGRPLASFLPDAAQVLARSGPGLPAQLGEMLGQTRHGVPVPLEVSQSFEQLAGGGMTTLFLRDLTQSKHMEAQRLALERQLRESQKMQAIGTMAGGIAHDFNNIISAILGNVALARDEAAPDSGLATSLTEIDKAGRRARDLVRQILTFSRNEPPHRQAISLADVVQETLRLIRVTLPPGVQLSARLDPSTPAVLADATQVEQVLLNLFTNAIHAIRAQPGQIVVELGPNNADAAREASEASAQAFPQQVQLQVRDSGCGMDAGTLERVFEPFFTTKPVGQGTGLGLSVVHGIMRAHDGLVQVSSTPGRGSTFTLRFPVASGDCAHHTPAQPSRAAMGNGQRVMYVDDDEALVFLVQRVLKRRGYTVITHTDPRQALAALRADPQQCDLLVTDYNMPGYSGVDLLRDIQALCPALPVALASGYVTSEIESAARAAGARALIHKPNDVDEMCDTVRQLLDASASTS